MTVILNRLIMIESMRKEDDNIEVKHLTVVGLFARIAINFTIILVAPAIAYWLYVDYIWYWLSDYLRSKLIILPGDITKLNAKMMEYSFCGYIILVSFFVLFCNTLYSYVNYIEEGERVTKKGKIVGFLYPLWVILALGAAGYIIKWFSDVKIFIENLDYLTKVDYFEEQFTTFVNYTGHFTLVLYIVFILIDIFQYLSVKNQSELKGRLSLQQLWFVDVATLFGVIAINYVTIKADITTLDTPLNVFLCGATGMQVILSQFVFFFIFALYNKDVFYRKQKYSLDG